MSGRRAAMKGAVGLDPVDTSDQDVWDMLEAEARLLRPYVGTGGPRKLLARMEDIRAAQWRITLRRERDTETPT